ncbi:peptide chain release factor 2 [Candidatus Bipolaricaulota sp. J31]
MEDILKELKERLKAWEDVFELSRMRERISELEKLMSQPNFWDDKKRARELIAELESLKERVRVLEELGEKVEEAEVLLSLADEGDPSAREEAGRLIAELQEDFRKARIALFLRGPYDRGDCFISLNAGAGGTDAQDWTEMLLRMYTRFCERAGFKVRLLDETPGEEAGIKSATLEVKGPYAYGLLKGETGVHRLVRISPFDAARRRHTSFASVTVTPIVPEEDIEIKEEDLKIETFRAGGPGGQHMQKNETAVRITHIPTGITVSCQNERSQHQNKEMALRILKARLRALMEETRAKKIEELRGELREIEWGNQIRSYILQPYQLVRDHRTEVEVGNVEAVLDGDLWPFIWAWLERGEAEVARTKKEVK